jgi:hypothetical protein
MTVVGWLNSNIDYKGSVGVVKVDGLVEDKQQKLDEYGMIK